MQEFLKKEFSAENIYFWISCERFRLLCEDSSNSSSAEKNALASAIVEKHLTSGAAEPVNVDSVARSAVLDGVKVGCDQI